MGRIIYWPANNKTKLRLKIPFNTKQNWTAGPLIIYA